MLEHPYIIEKLEEYREREAGGRLLRRIRNCTRRLMKSETGFTHEKRSSGGDSEIICYK
ncbi:hypothetical protein GCM10010912_40470 [Paenibacillus albidus]|uniref:Uncharacterized protein n=1 Tax=Paenibacillus albidus TaxID=2041023 RepID=A0A917CL73_9BACL|nr:hypothetical protein GCM10010912_40470 [Paenibacillus albidus]